MYWLTLLPLLSLAAISKASNPACVRSLTNLLDAACSTRTQFCQDLFPKEHTETTTYTTNVDKTIYTQTKTYTRPVKTKTIPYSTKTIIKTLTTTSASSTTTIESCGPLIACDAATVDRNDCIKGACFNYLTKTITATRTITHTEVKSEFKYKSTTTTKEQYGYPVTTYKVITTSVAGVATTTTCVTASPPVQTCDNAGYQVAYYTLDDADIRNNLNPFDLDHYKTIKPDSNDTSSYGLGRNFVYYDYEDTGDCEEEYQNYRGYIYAPQTGDYSFNVLDVDNIADYWIGNIAYTGYNSSNVLLSSNVTGPYVAHAKTYLERGKYYPFRVAWACVYERDDGGYFSAYNWFANIRRPDGVVLEGSYGSGYTPEVYSPGHYYLPHYKESKYIVQFGCGRDAELAPAFPDWGNET